MAGQALPWGLALTSVAVFALVAVYNLGQVALARTRLTHATDAAAYSGAVVQARSLNMLAHVQRTQIAHQVAIAHLVTLGAWAQFVDTQSARYRRGNPPGFIVGRFLGRGITGLTLLPGLCRAIFAVHLKTHWMGTNG
jgi:hypothetical protein